MNRIYKYPLEILDEQVIRMPRGARVLTVQTQNDGPCVWAQIDDSYELENVVFRTVGTGHKMVGMDSYRYVGTTQHREGYLVFHHFQKM